MKYLILALGLIISSAAFAADALKCRRIQTVSCDTISGELPFDVKPMSYEPGFTIYYLVEAQDLIGFKDDSLVIESIVGADGKDCSKKRNGSANYEMGSFPKCTEDGKFGVFAVEVKENKFGQVDALVITGKVLALTGADLQTAKLSFTVGDTAVQNAGELKVSIGNATGFMSSDANLGVTVAGKLDAVSAIKVMDGAKELGRQGWMGGGDSRTYQFDKPSGTAITIELSYWKSMSEVEVVIEK
jgi:hypothetical protein